MEAGDGNAHAPLINAGAAADADERVMDPIWVAFSGGGLRSCAVAAGALREMAFIQPPAARKRLEILSAVSGGGYAAGSFVLHAWREAEPDITRDALAFAQTRRGFLRLLTFLIILAGTLLVMGKDVAHDLDCSSVVAVPWCVLTNLLLPHQTSFEHVATALASVAVFLAVLYLAAPLVIALMSFAFWVYPTLIQHVPHIRHDSPFCTTVPYFPTITSINPSRSHWRQPHVLQSFRNRVRANIGFIISLAVPRSNILLLIPLTLLTLLKALIDAFFFLFALVIGPVLLLLLTAFPAAVAVSVLAVHAADPSVPDKFPLMDMFFTPFARSVLRLSANESEHFYWSTHDLPTSCANASGQPWRRHVNDSHFRTASPANAFFAFPVAVGSFLIFTDAVRLLLELGLYVSGATKQTSYPLLVPTGLRETSRTIVFTMFLGVGLLAQSMMYPALACTSFAGGVLLFQFFLGGAALMLSLLFTPRRGGVLTSALMCSTMAFFVLVGVGPARDVAPPPGNDPWLPNHALGTSWTLITQKDKWSRVLLVAGGLCFAYPCLVASKNILAHAWYRHRISRSFFPAPRETVPWVVQRLSHSWNNEAGITRALNVVVLLVFGLPAAFLDAILHDTLNIPFSFIKMKVFPHDETTFNDLAAANIRPALVSQMAMQFWNSDFGGRQDVGKLVGKPWGAGNGRAEFDETSVFPDGATQRRIFTWQTDTPGTAGGRAPNGVPPPQAQAPRNAFYVVSDENDASPRMVVEKSAGLGEANRLDVATAVAVSGAAVGANVGSLSTPSVPSSFLALLGGLCSRWIRVRNINKAMEVGWALVGSALFVGCGWLFLTSSSAACKGSQTHGGGDTGKLPWCDAAHHDWVWVASFVLLHVFFLFMAILLVVPWASTVAYLTGASSSGVFAAMLTVLGVPLYANAMPASLVSLLGKLRWWVDNNNEALETARTWAPTRLSLIHI